MILTENAGNRAGISALAGVDLYRVLPSNRGGNSCLKTQEGTVSKSVVALILLCTSLLPAQTVPQPPKKKPAVPPAAAAAPAKVVDPAKAQQQERGLQLLEIAEAQASGLQGGVRAYAMLQLARSHESRDKAKALQLLEDAMTATSEMEATDRGNIRYARAQLQQQILQEMVPSAPQRAEELLSQVEPGDREPVLNALLGYYEKNKDLDHAIELVYRIGQEKEIPYGAAGRIMAALPEEKNGDVLQLFSTAFASFRDHKHPGVSVGGGDFSALVLQFWHRLPPNLVHDAIDELLKQAADVDANISISGDGGSASFGSLYNYRLFQLLPVLRKIDESQANELLTKNQEIKGMLAKYPEGVGSISPDMVNPTAQPDKNKRGSGTSFSVSTGRPGAGGGTAPLNVNTMRTMQEQQVRKIAADADKDPSTALAQAAGISDAWQRAGLYQSIARSAAKKDPPTARTALEKLLEVVDQLPDFAQVNALRTATELYLQMGETDAAKKVVERGFVLAEKLFKTDSNADDPNNALKAYWPSADAWRTFTRLAGQISPVWALTQLNEISDTEMKVLAEVALAQGWLDVSRGTTVVMTSRKGNQSMSVSRESPQ